MGMGVRRLLFWIGHLACALFVHQTRENDRKCGVKGLLFGEGFSNEIK